MSYRRRRARQCFSAPQADCEIGNTQRVEKGERLLFASLEIKREGRPRAGAMATVDVGLPRFIFEEAEVSYLLDLGMGAEEFADLRGIFARTVHAQL